MTLSDEGARYLTGAPRSDCARCGTVYYPHLAEWAFRKPLATERLSSRVRYQVCRACEYAARDLRKQRNRWAVKARDVIRRHAARLDIDKDLLIAVYGWEPRRLAHDAKHQYAHGCSYCGELYAEMGHGFADITLDIQDRSRAPYYCTNTKWCCQDCNRKKGAMTPEAFEANRQIWKLWNEPKDGPRGEQGMLF